MHAHHSPRIEIVGFLGEIADFPPTHTHTHTSRPTADHPMFGYIGNAPGPLPDSNILWIVEFFEKQKRTFSSLALISAIPASATPLCLMPTETSWWATTCFSASIASWKWNYIPNNIDIRDRIWDWKDPQFLRARAQP